MELELTFIAPTGREGRPPHRPCWDLPPLHARQWQRGAIHEIVQGTHSDLALLIRIDTGDHDPCVIGAQEAPRWIALPREPALEKNLSRQQYVASLAA